VAGAGGAAATVAAGLGKVAAGVGGAVVAAGGAVAAGEGTGTGDGASGATEGIVAGARESSEPPVPSMWNWKICASIIAIRKPAAITAGKM